MLRMIDLFAGTGAFTSAFEQTGKVKCVFANDMVKHSKVIYDENFDHKLTLADIHSLDVSEIPAHDILTSGFPCQPFSISGLRAGFDDERSNVFWKMLKIIDHHNPRCIVLENVKNLVTHDDKKTFKTITSELEKRGYHITSKVLDTSKITGIPQHRERIYIVCFKDPLVHEKFNLDFPLIEKDVVTEMLETSEIPAKYYYTEKSSTWPLVSTSVTEKGKIYQYRRVYVRENKSSECPTLTANMGGGGHNVPIIRDDYGIRKLTPRECFSLQGFPLNFNLPNVSDSQLYKQAGNSVTVKVVKRIVEQMLKVL